MNILTKTTLVLALIASSKVIAHGSSTSAETNLYQNSSDIIVGHFDSTTSERIRGSVYTLVTFEASEVIKGEEQNYYSVIFSGGINDSGNFPVRTSGTIDHIPSLHGSSLLMLSPSEVKQGSYEITGTQISTDHGHIEQRVLDGFIPLSDDKFSLIQGPSSAAGTHVYELLDRLEHAEEIHSHSTTTTVITQTQSN